MGSDLAEGFRLIGLADFNPRSPDGERPRGRCSADVGQCISIHAPRMGSDRAVRVAYQQVVGISIHAPRMGSDDLDGRAGLHSASISIHAPRMGSDGASRRDRGDRGYFNPRSPDGERLGARTGRTGSRDFNPRSPDGERQQALIADEDLSFISIHAPRMGSDTAWYPTYAQIIVFQSTLPGWGATIP